MKIDKKLLKNLDFFIIAMIFLLVGVGLLFIIKATASPFTGEESTFSEVFEKIDISQAMLQLLWFALGLVLMVIVCMIDYHVYGDLINIAYIVLLVMLVFLVVAGKAINGTTAWLKFNERAFQPSELFKIVLIILVAKYAAAAMDKYNCVKINKDFWKMMAFIALPLLLVCIQPDLGTAMVYICIVAGILFAGKLSWKAIFVLMLVAVGLAIAAFFAPNIMEDYQKMRILNFLGLGDDTTLLEKLHISADALQRFDSTNVDAAISSISSGGMFGIGLFSAGSTAQLGYVYADSTDFIFAAGIESVGLVGGIVIMVLYLALLIRTMYLAFKAKDHFGSFIIVGVVFLELAHIFENIAMNMGLMPVTGIPLPFISYGGSSMWTNMIAFGLVLNIAMRRPTKRYNASVIH